MYTILGGKFGKRKPLQGLVNCHKGTRLFPRRTLSSPVVCVLSPVPKILDQMQLLDATLKGVLLQGVFFKTGCFTYAEALNSQSWAALSIYTVFKKYPEEASKGICGDADLVKLQEKPICGDRD